VQARAVGEGHKKLRFAFFLFQSGSDLVILARAQTFSNTFKSVDSHLLVRRAPDSDHLVLKKTIAHHRTGRWDSYNVAEFLNN
jgi:hypothetical protein